MVVERKKLFGCPMISSDSFDGVVDELEAYSWAVNHTDLPFVYTPNSFNLVLFTHWHQKDFSLLQQSAFVLPDGFPVVLTSKLKGTPLKARLTGADLFEYLWRRVQSNKVAPVLFVCSEKKVGQMLQQEYFNTHYYVPPFFEIDDVGELKNVVASTCELIKSVKPKYVFLGISDPKQQRIGIEVQQHLSDQGFDQMPLFLFLGASFEFHLNLRERAPIFFQKAGLEWFYRFMKEPRKLFYRYFVLGWLFFPLMIKEIFKKPR